MADPKQQSIIINPPTAHSPKQELIMQFFLHPGVREMWVPCGTKFGKSMAAAAAECNGMVKQADSLWRWVAPIYLQTKVGFEYCKTIMPKPPEVQINNSDLSITLPGNNSKLQFFHASNPTSLEGPAVAGYVMDEAAKMKSEAYAASKTTTTVTRGKHLVLSTPYGKNWFYKKCMQAREEMLWAHQKGIVPAKVFITARSQDNPMVSAEAIAEAKAELPERLFRQYYMAEFIDDGSVFIRFRDCMYGDPIVTYGNYQRWIHPTAAKGANVVIGVDWAKTVDWTVFIAVDLETRHVIGFERFQKTAYTDAIKQLIIFSRAFKEVEMVYHDKTGVGEALDDQLDYTDLAFKGITFTSKSKSSMVNSLMTSFEQARILIPRWSTLETELEIYEVVTNELGNMSFSAPTGSHDDVVSALMLANAALDDYGDRSFDVRSLDDLGKLPNDPKPEPGSLEAFYKAIIDESEEDDGP